MNKRVSVGDYNKKIKAIGIENMTPDMVDRLKFDFLHGVRTTYSIKNYIDIFKIKKLNEYELDKFLRLVKDSRDLKDLVGYGVTQRDLTKLDPRIIKDYNSKSNIMPDLYPEIPA